MVRKWNEEVVSLKHKNLLTHLPFYNGENSSKMKNTELDHLQDIIENESRAK